MSDSTTQTYHIPRPPEQNRQTAANTTSEAGGLSSIGKLFSVVRVREGGAGRGLATAADAGAGGDGCAGVSCEGSSGD